MKEVVRVPDNLRITAPVTPNESVIRPSQTPAEAPQVLPTNPNRVPGNGNQTENPGYQTGELLQNRGSVFGQFIEQLRATPDLSKSLQGLLLSAVARQESIAARQPADAPLPTLLAALKMDPQQVAESLSFQQENATQFSGPLFRLLGQISEQSTNAGFDLRLADFLKAFSGYFSRQSTTHAALANLDRIRGEIPLAYAKDLRKAMGPMDGQDGESQAVENLDTLKKEVIPFLAKYVAQTNDYGKVRDEISMLLHNTAILNVSTRENLGDRFEQLFRYCKYNLNLPDATMDLLRSLFGEELAAKRTEKSDAFYSALVQLLSSAGGGAGGTSGGADRAVLHDVTRSILLDNSVYMPFQHLFLPVDIDGRLLFAQMWVEKKEEDEPGARGRGGTAARPTAIYLTFDIQDLGYFEASIHILDRHVDLRLGYPPAFDRFRGAIRSELSSILEKNGLNAEDVRVSPCAEATVPRAIQDKIEERRNSVNVSV